MKPRKMKDTGVEWLGSVPEGWSLRCLFQQVRQVKNKNENLREKNLLSLSYGKIKRKSIDAAGGLLPASFEGYNRIEPGDIVLRLTDLQNDQHSLRTGLSKERGIVTSAYVTVRPSIETSSDFLHFALYAFDVAKGFYGMGSGVRQGLTYDDIKLLKLPHPPLPEQRAIAAYLDERCAKIDTMIVEAKETIEEYKQWKQSLIFEAVTGKVGVGERCRCRKMRDSGVKWIGRVPEGWMVSRVKNEVLSLDHLREPISAENRVNERGLYDYYGASGAIDKIDDYNVDDVVLLIGEDGANLRMRNLPLVYRAKGKIWVNNHAHILKVKPENDYGFFGYMLESGDYNEYITGTAQPKLSQFNLFRFPIPVPPLPEQRAIAAYLDRKCAAIDRVVAEKEGLIADLEQYKKSLIFECVTGKREVA